MFSNQIFIQKKNKSIKKETSSNKAQLLTNYKNEKDIVYL